MRPALAFTWGLSILALGGCDDLSRFRTDAREHYRGEVVGDEGESFIRRGFAPGTILVLEFDPTASDEPEPGAITTSADAITGEHVFSETPLRSIATLQHDLLSEYDFPGGNRVRNFMYVATPTEGPLAGRDAMIFISLLEDGSVETRVIAGSGDESRGDHFGYFRMRRQAR